MLRAFLRTKHPTSYAFKFLFLFLLYVTTGLLGLTLHPINSFATFIWLPSGISLAFLILLGYRLWPAIFLGACVVNLVTGASPFAAIGIATGNTCEALIAYIILVSGGFEHALGRLRDVVLLLFLAAPLGSIIAATIGTGSLFLSGILTSYVLYPTWQAWFVGDLMSIILITPLILTWFSQEPYHFLRRPKGAEALLLLAVTTFVGFSVFHGRLGGIFSGSPRTYLVFPLLIWASLRFGPRAATTCIFILSLAAITGILEGVGPSASLPIERALFSEQLFMGIVAGTALILASVDAERKAYETRKDEFIALASHELKTPLTSLKILSQSLPKIFNTRPSHVLPYLRKIDVHTEKLTELVASLLDVSKMQSNMLEFSKEYFSLATSLEELLPSMKHMTKHGISLKYTKSISSLLLYADKTRIEQVMTNLLTNAMKYSPEHKRIIIRINQQRNTLIASVQDFGDGISSSEQKKVFERYYRAKEHKTYPGLGLGLYVSKQIVKQHSGKLWVESSKGKGSTFFVRLPIEKRSTSFWQRGFARKTSE